MRVAERELVAETGSGDALTLAGAVPVTIGKLRRRLREEGGSADLTPSQAAAITRLETLGESTITELASAEGVRPQSMGATVAALQALGFVVGTPDPNDGRRTILSLSEMAVEKFFANRAARESWLFHSIRESLSASERRDLARGLTVLDKLAGS